ncbi:MAG: hypothetical protein ACYTBJ_02230 [Planctomycetota bacterium]|jgi:hypothetical protein
MNSSCTGCPSFTGEVPFDVRACEDLDTDCCVEHRLKGLVRDQWIFESTPVLPCRKCGSALETTFYNTTSNVEMLICKSCDKTKGPLPASPIAIARAGQGAWSKQARRIAREHLERSHGWVELAASIGYDFTPQCFTDPWADRLEAIKAAVAKGAGLVITLAQVSGDWL